jgi:ligand-binding sensor domain-containing protein
MKKHLIILGLMMLIAIPDFAQEFENLYSGHRNQYSLFLTDSLVFVGGDNAINIYRTDGSYKETKRTQGNVYSIVSDQQGKLHFSVYSQTDGGILTYDGDNWGEITAENGLPDKRVFQLAFDQDGKLWVSFEDWVGEPSTYLSVYDGDEWTNITEIGDSLSITGANEIVVDSLNRVFIGVYATGTGGVLCIHGSDTTFYTPGNSAINLACMHSSFVDRNNNAWFGGCFGRLSRFDGSQWQVEAQDSLFEDQAFYSIGQKASGDMLFGTPEGLFLENGDSWTQYSTENGLLLNYIFDIKTADDDKVWMATIPFDQDGSPYGCLSLFSGEDFSHFLPDTHGGHPRNVCFAGDSVFSFGSPYNSGLVSEFNGNTWQVHWPVENYAVSYAFDVDTDASGNIWFAKPDGLFVQDAAGNTEQIETILGDSIFYARDVACANNSLWVNTGSALYQYYQDEWTIVDVSSLPESGYIEIHPVNDTAFWLHCNECVGKYNGNSWTIYDSDSGLEEDVWIYDMTVHNDSVWLATISGAVLIAGDEITTHLCDTASDSGCRQLNAVHVDERGLIWFGHQTGISLYDMESVTELQPAGYEENIFSITEDDNQTIWVCSQTCISKYRYDLNSADMPEAGQMSLYPNPADNKLYMVLHADCKDDSLLVFDAQGRFVLSQAVKPGRNAINVQNLPAGLYFTRLRQMGISGKFVVR